MGTDVTLRIVEQLGRAPSHVLPIFRDVLSVSAKVLCLTISDPNAYDSLKCAHNNTYKKTS